MSKKKNRPDKPKVRGLHGRIRLLMSHFRLSLTFRIALHYCWQVLRTTLAALLITTLFIGFSALGQLEDDLRRIRMGDPLEDGSFSQEVLQNSDMEAVLIQHPYSTEGSTVLQYRITQLYAIGSELTLQVEVQHHTGSTILLTCGMQRHVRVWRMVMIGALLCDLMRMVSFLSRRERLNKSVLAPIRDITEMATTLSASNLSNRINIAGTKNELKDLAMVINSMLDRIERSYNSQKQFVSDASHELRTPIAVIQGYVSMLQRWGKSDPEVLDEGISAIAQETASMKDLVESLLFLARHDKKTLMLEMEKFDALDVASELHREAAMVTPEDTFELTPADSCVIEGDRGMIKQVMRILLDNAVKYTPKGGRVVIGVQRDQDSCTLSITDNGPGISSAELPKIFERFYRSDSARKSEGGGHGLGLSIARIIVIAHGGKLRVRSKVGEGSTFFVVLPLTQKKQAPAEAPKA